MPAKKPAPVVMDPSGVFVKLPLSPRQAALVGALIEQLGTLLDAGGAVVRLAGEVEGEASRAIATRSRRRPRARRR